MRLKCETRWSLFYCKQRDYGYSGFQSNIEGGKSETPAVLCSYRMGRLVSLHEWLPIGPMHQFHV